MATAFDWFLDEPNRAETALLVFVLVLAAAGVWFSRSRLTWALPVAALFVVYAASVIPCAIPARPIAQRNACINQLRLIEHAKLEWARATAQPTNAVTTFSDLSGTTGTYRFLRALVNCPRGGTYSIGSLDEPPSCSLSARGHRLD